MCASFKKRAYLKGELAGLLGIGIGVATVNVAGSYYVQAVATQQEQSRLSGFFDAACMLDGQAVDGSVVELLSANNVATVRTYSGVEIRIPADGCTFKAHKPKPEL